MKSSSNTLDKIVAAKKVDLEARKLKKPQAQLEKELATAKPFAGPGFFDVLKAKQPTPKIIAEVKQASPSKGVIRDNFSLDEINRAYQDMPHVVAVSVLTERDYFHGSEDTLAFFAANNKNKKPLLRKDFIFDPYQVLETRLLGAQAYLLIASLFDDTEDLEKLIKVGQELGLEALVEVHSREELALAKATSARIIGVNSRNLKTLEIEPATHELLREIDDTYAKIAESGIESAEQLKYVTGFCDAALVGTSLMAAPDISQAVEELVR